MSEQSKWVENLVEVKTTKENPGGEATKDLNLGKTGEHPDGKIHPTDDGELRFAIGVTKSAEVFMEFGTPVKWLALPPQQAIQLAQMLGANAQKAMRVVDVLKRQAEKTRLVGKDGRPLRD